jgi:hypothetical protein
MNDRQTNRPTHSESVPDSESYTCAGVTTCTSIPMCVCFYMVYDRTFPAAAADYVAADDAKDEKARTLKWANKSLICFDYFSCILAVVHSCNV